MTTTEFDDTAHYGIFTTNQTLTSSAVRYARLSEIVLSSLRAQGVFDNLVDSTTAPTTDRLWLDKNSDPAVFKEYDPIGSVWEPMTFDRMFGRAVVTNLTNVGGTANAITVDQPTNFISERLYALTPTANNTGAATIQVAGVGTYDVKYHDGTDIDAGEMVSGDNKVLLFTNGRFEVLTPYAAVFAAEAAAVAAQAAAEQAAAESAAANPGLPTAVANSVLVRNAANDAYESVDIGLRAPKRIQAVTRTRNLWTYLDADPTSTIGEANSAWERVMAEIVSDARPAALEVPEYLYPLTRTLKTPVGIPFTLQCAGGYATRFIADVSGNWGSGVGESDRMIGPPSSAEVSGLRIFNAPVLLGEDRVDYGYHFETLTHSEVHNPEILGVNQWAWRSNGYSNSIRNPKIHSCAGSGIGLFGLDALEGLGNSNCRISDGIIYSIGGIGMRISDGWSISVDEVGIEDCAVTGIIASNVDGLKIKAYFETNGANGYSLTDGSETFVIRADVLLLSRTLDLFMADRDKGCRGVVIEASEFTVYGGYNAPVPAVQDCAVFAFSADDIRISNNRVRGLEGAFGVPGSLKGLVGVYNNGFRGKTSSMVIEQNTVNDVVQVGTGLPSYAYDTAHNISNRFVPPVNIADQNFLSYTVAVGTTGYLRNSGAQLSGFDMWAIGPGDRVWQKSIPLPESMRGKLLRLAALYVPQETGSGLWLGAFGGTYSASSHDGTIGETITSMANPYDKSILLRTAPGDTTITVQLRYAGTGSNPVLFAGLNLCEVGVSMADALAVTPPEPVYKATAAPTEGTWRFGTRVIYDPPTVGQSRAWVCTVGGGPGTWVSEGNL